MTKKIANKKRASLVSRPRSTAQMLAACGILVGSFALQSCEKDVLTGQPSWLGNSIYERLEEGIEVDGQTKTFKTTLKLIDDLGYKETLSRTGSKTVFVASDEDYTKWFSSNSWGVTSYEQLTLAQKKQLFNGTMVNNAYLLELMSNVPATGNADPEQGMCMRRETAASIYDNIPVENVADFPYNATIAQMHEEDATVPDDPANIAWANVRSQGKNIHIFKDATSAPMIHFLPEFMKKNNITAEDLQLISNGQSDNVKDSWINGQKVISNEQTCKNGYVYVVDGVMASNQSMAEIVNNNDQTKIWSKLMKRFSVPVAMSRADQNEFWRLNPEAQAAGDSIYNLRYLNQSGNHGLATPTNNSEDALNATGLLKFDPGWNQYKADNNQILMQNDAAAMLVPTDAALTEWFNNGAGRSLKDKFGDWDAIPYETLVKLINVNLLESFVSSVPSKFPSILDDSQRSMGVEKDNIVRCYMGCNGVVYVTNKVFQPSEFSSVMYPANIQSTGVFSVIYHALTGNYTKTQDTSLDFSPYLTAMDSRFSLILPYNVYTSYKTTVKSPVFRMIDPCSYGLPQQYLLEFYYANQKIAGLAYPCTVAEDGTVTLASQTSQTLSDDVVANRLNDLINNLTIIEDIDDAKQYYKTKAGSVMKAFKQNGTQCFQGGFQIETGEVISVPEENVYNMGPAGTGNGVTYGVSGDPDADMSHIDIPMTASKSVYEVLKAEAEAGGDSLFYSLIFSDESGVDDEKGTLSATQDGSYYCTNPTGNQNLKLFDNYNYTVYVPTDKAIKEMIDNGYLPTWEDYNEAPNEEAKKKIADRIHNFIRYHVQDNSIFIGGDKVSAEQYESAKLNPENNRFYSIRVTQDGEDLTVVDQLNNVRHVVKDNGFYNKACKEYWLKTTGAKVLPTVSNVYKCTVTSASNAVVHKIDGVLLYDKSQQNNWRY